MGLLHIWSQYEVKNAETQRRMALAQQSWREMRWRDVPVPDSTLPRLFTEGTLRMPFIRDLFDTGIRGADPNDIAVFTNADIGMAPHSDIAIALAMQVNDAGYGNRRDFGHKLLGLPSEQDIRNAAPYCGTDLFFFRVAWWQLYRTEFPDMLIGREAWDACMRVLIEASNPHKPLSLDCLCWHERHGGTNYWENPKLRYSLPGQIHNLSLAKRFVRKYGYDPTTFGIR